MQIYKITNLLNSMVYVGKTTKTLDQRLAKHICDAFSKTRKRGYLANAIAKYGQKNFKIEHVASATNRQELAKMESKYILKLNSLWPNGYNLIVRDDNLNIVSNAVRKKCSQGGKMSWVNYPLGSQLRQKNLQKAGEAASIKNRERTGQKIRTTKSKYIGVCPQKCVNKYGSVYHYWRGYYANEFGKQISKQFKLEEDAAKFYEQNTRRVRGNAYVDEQRTLFPNIYLPIPCL